MNWQPTCKNYFTSNAGFECPEPVLIRNNHFATHLFRIAQEAINNAIKHGKAKHVPFR